MPGAALTTILAAVREPLVEPHLSHFMQVPFRTARSCRTSELALVALGSWKSAAEIPKISI
jgi:hypothetical protein